MKNVKKDIYKNNYNYFTSHFFSFSVILDYYNKMNIKNENVQEFLIQRSAIGI